MPIADDVLLVLEECLDLYASAGETGVVAEVDIPDAAGAMTGPGQRRFAGAEDCDAGGAAPSQALRTTDSHEGGASLQGNHY